MILPMALFLAFTSCFLMGGWRWQSSQVDEVSYNDLFKLAVYVVADRGYKVHEANADTGRISSQWDYRKLVDLGRFPIRRKAKIEVDPMGEGVYEIRVVVVQEALWDSPYGGGVDVKNKKGWEGYGDDVDAANDILTRIKMMVKDFTPSDAFYDKYRKIEEIQESIPDVLDEPLKK